MEKTGFWIIDHRLAIVYNEFLFVCWRVILYHSVCAKRDTVSEINKKKTEKKLLCDWLLPPVFRFIVPSRISCGEMRKTCCFSVCIRSRQTPSFRQTPGPMPRCVLCMDQSEGPTQPGVDDNSVTFGLIGHHRRGGLYLSFILMFGYFFFFMCPAPHFLQPSKDSSFSFDLLLLHGPIHETWM